MRSFIIVICGQLVSDVGSKAIDFAFSVWIFEQTGSATLFALSILISAVPRIALSPLTGSIVDRLDRKRIMVLSELGLTVRAAVVLFILVISRIEIWQIFALNAIASVLGSYRDLAWSAAVPDFVDKKHLARAAGVSHVFGSGANIVAPALSGVLYVTVGLVGIAAVDLGTWAFALIPLFWLRTGQVDRRSRSSQSNSFVSDLSLAWKHLRSMKGLFLLLIIYSSIGFFGITTEVLLGPYVLSFSDAPVFGMLQAVVSVGMVCGGVALSIVGTVRRPIIWILSGELSISIMSVAIGATPVVAVLACAVFIYFFSVSFCDGTIDVLWQRKIRSELRGRVFALRDFINMSLMPIGILVFSPIAQNVLEPNLSANGAWSTTIGRFIGTGPGRGIGFLFILSGIATLLIVVGGLMSKTLRGAGSDIPDVIR